MQLCLEETRAMTFNNKYLNIQDKTRQQQQKNKKNNKKNNRNTEVIVHHLNF